ncbi:MAG: ATP-binding protein [Streptococcaceae bacterium]|jgi:hypothetical protein|nr:ATP-binding protein [Streptococcaceae bacterium]
MSFEVTTGPRQVAQKCLIYGVEGIGKSSLAAQFPTPLFIDTEGSTDNMNVSRLPKPTSWQMLFQEIEAVKQERNCGTLVIDTADWAAYLCEEYIIAQNKWTSIEDGGYGSGYVKVREEFGRLLNKLSDLTEIDINVVVTANSEMKKAEIADDFGAFDHYQMKLSRQAAPLLREWCDMMLFLNYKTTIITDSKSKSKKATGGERVMYTTHHPAWDAKNRFGLSEELPLDFSSIVKIFQRRPQKTQTAAPVQAVNPEPVQEELVPIPKHDEQAFARDKAILDSAIPKALSDLMTAGGISELELQQAMARNGVLPVEMAVKDYPDETVHMIIANWGGIAASVAANRTF